MDSIVFSRGSDPLWRDVPLDSVADTSLFGIPVRVESNAKYVTDQVARAYGGSRGANFVTTPAAGIRLRIVLEPALSREPSRVPVQWRFPDPDHAIIRGSGLAATVDLTHGEGVAYVEEPFARDASQFRHVVIEGMVLSLLTRRDRHPVHAAALRSGDGVLLLQGTTGAGKSTLCYVAHGDGMDVFSEDAVWVQRDPELRIWGWGGRVHLLEDARVRFPELREHGTVRTSEDGMHKLAVDLRPVVPSSPQAPFVRRARVCLLTPGREKVSRESVSPDEICRALVGAREADFDLSPNQRVHVARALAAHGGWRLHLSQDPEEALPHLRAMVAEVRRDST